MIDQVTLWDVHDLQEQWVIMNGGKPKSQPVSALQTELAALGMGATIKGRLPDIYRNKGSA